MKLSVVVASINRPSLAAALSSCRGADEVIVVADGPDAHGAEKVLRSSGLAGRAILLPRRYQDYGHTPRQIALGFCTGDWIAHLDDDDTYFPGAAEAIKASLTRLVPHFFRVDMPEIGHPVWKDPELRVGNISTLGIVHPNDRRWGLWGATYSGDHAFAASTAAHYPSVVWVDRIIARCEQHNYGQ